MSHPRSDSLITITATLLLMLASLIALGALVQYCG